MSAQPSQLTGPEFEALMEQLAAAWSRQDTDSAVACFTPDAVYMQPPNLQFYTGHDQFKAYFGALKPGTFMRFHHLWFDERRQVGAGEFSFGMAGDQDADHGVTVVEIRDGRIALWREYFRNGPSDFADFIRPDGKTWQWHIGNYP